MNQDFRHLVACDIKSYLTSKGVSESAVGAQADKVLDALDWFAYEALWEKPEGCECGGPADPYHGFCDPCAERRMMVMGGIKAMSDDVWIDKHQRKWFGYWQRKLDGAWGYRMHFSGWDTDMGDLQFADFEKCFGPVEPMERAG